MAQAQAVQPNLLESGRNSLRIIKAHLNSQFVERESVIESASIALAGRFNLFLGGPPGTGKSQIAQAITDTVQDGFIFDIQMFRQTDAMELLGPWNPEMLRQGRLVRVKEGFLQEAVVAFIDEVDKGGTALNALLRPMNERTYREGRELVKMPLRTVISASNASLSEPTLAALMDRYHMRHWVSYVQDLTKFKEMMVMATTPHQPCPVKITCQELDAIQDTATMVEISKEAIETLAKLRQTMKNGERIFSDRRWIQILKAAQVHVAIEGDSTQVLPHHLRIAVPFLTDRDNDSDIVKWINADVPAPPVTPKTNKSMRIRFDEARMLKNPQARIETLRSLLSEIQVAMNGVKNKALSDLKLEIISALNDAMQGFKGGAR